MRSFIIKWKENKKYALERENLVDVTKDTGDIGIDAKAALNLFCATIGNLKKNEIISIQEIDENGKNIGEPIVPISNENSIVPLVKKRS